MEEVHKEVRNQRLQARLEAKLERENNNTTLDNHWVDIKGMHINQPLSDYHCKQIYGQADIRSY
jgi:hypothetical protein